MSSPNRLLSLSCFQSHLVFPPSFSPITENRCTPHSPNLTNQVSSGRGQLYLPFLFSTKVQLRWTWAWRCPFVLLGLLCFFYLPSVHSWRSHQRGRAHLIFPRHPWFGSFSRHPLQCHLVFYYFRVVPLIEDEDAAQYLSLPALSRQLLLSLPPHLTTSFTSVSREHGW